MCLHICLIVNSGEEAHSNERHFLPECISAPGPNSSIKPELWSFRNMASGIDGKNHTAERGRGRLMVMNNV